MKKFCLVSIFNLFCLIANAQEIQLINMVPNAQSNETNQDSEPNMSINPASPNQIIGTAFTRNPLGATTPPSAPLYFSLDGGLTWVLNSIVPSNIGTGDITAKFGTTTSRLYAGILRLPATTGAFTTMDILRTNNFTGTALMQQISTRDEPDQPFIQAASVLSGSSTGIDRIYVGNNDGNAASNQTSTIDQSMDAFATTPTFNTIRIEQRTPANRDAPPVRTAIHPDGVIYSAFFSQTSLNTTTNVVTGNIVVIRDDNWGLGTTPFSDLTDPGDGTVGMRVVTGITCPFAGNSLGQERIWQRMNIAVNPNNSNQVYVVYSDFPTGAAPYTLHVRRSDNAGVTWTGDIRTVTNATVPSLAINALGEVAFSYQRLNAGNWETIVERTNNNFINTASSTLNTFPDGNPVRTGQPYLGDYAHMMALPFGKDFCGVFSASNDPNPARFPTVQPTWQRNIDAATNRLRNLTNTSNVNISIDPYFYRISPITLNEDFYVRDWTNTTTDRDLGQEPSTNPVFYRTSDIWNRRSNTPGTFNANDQPENQDPWPAATGHNFAFTRVHRREVGNAATVNGLFLKSEFGTGSNYQLMNGPLSLAQLSFSATDLQQTMTTGVQWDLVDPAAITANHVCIAVEIATPNDLPGNPTLIGRAPGWSNGTDLLVINDNNKAQRNLQVYTGTGGAGESMTMYAVAHNASLIERDMHIVLNPYTPKNNKEKYKVSVIGEKEKGRSIIKGNSLILTNMKPCENRWIEFSVSDLPNLNAAPVSYLFEERVNEMRINGFEIDVNSGKLDQVGEENLGEHSFVFERLVKQFSLPTAQNQAKAALELLHTGVSESAYISFMEKNGMESIKIITDFTGTQQSDPFAVIAAGNNLSAKIRNKEWNEAAMAHGNFMRRINAYLSYLDKSGGDVADIIQTIRWFNDIIRRSQTFKHSQLGNKSIEQAEKFIDQYSKRVLVNKDYPLFVNENLSLWMELVKKHIPGHNFDAVFSAMKQNMNDPRRLQKINSQFVKELLENVIL